LAQIINIFNPNIFEILIFTKTIFFGEGKWKIFWNILDIGTYYQNDNWGNWQWYILHKLIISGQLQRWLY
jgi:hypothetical protein